MSWGERAIIQELRAALLLIHTLRVREGEEKETILHMKQIALQALEGDRPYEKGDTHEHRK